MAKSPGRIGSSKRQASGTRHLACCVSQQLKRQQRENELQFYQSRSTRAIDAQAKLSSIKIDSEIAEKDTNLSRSTLSSAALPEVTSNKITKDLDVSSTVSAELATAASESRDESASYVDKFFELALNNHPDVEELARFTFSLRGKQYLDVRKQIYTLQRQEQNALLDNAIAFAVRQLERQKTELFTADTQLIKEIDEIITALQAINGKSTVDFAQRLGLYLAQLNQLATVIAQPTALYQGDDEQDQDKLRQHKANAQTDIVRLKHWLYLIAPPEHMEGIVGKELVFLKKCLEQLDTYLAGKSGSPELQDAIAKLKGLLQQVDDKTNLSAEHRQALLTAVQNQLQVIYRQPDYASLPLDIEPLARCIGTLWRRNLPLIVDPETQLRYEIYRDLHNKLLKFTPSSEEHVSALGLPLAPKKHQYDDVLAALFNSSQGNFAQHPAHAAVKQTFDLLEERLRNQYGAHNVKFEYDIEAQAVKITAEVFGQAYERHRLELHLIVQLPTLQGTDDKPGFILQLPNASKPEVDLAQESRKGKEKL